MTTPTNDGGRPRGDARLDRRGHGLRQADDGEERESSSPRLVTPPRGRRLGVLSPPSIGSRRRA